MLRLFVQARETVYGLRADKRGVVSFEYVIVAACMVAAVAAAFGTGTASGNWLGAEHSNHGHRYSGHKRSHRRVIGSGIGGNATNALSAFEGNSDGNYHSLCAGVAAAICCCN